jgi:hypothetical protein
MDEPCPDKISITRQILEVMVEKSDDRGLFYISNTIGMREDSFGFIENEVVFFFYENRNFDFGSLF